MGDELQSGVKILFFLLRIVISVKYLYLRFSFASKPLLIRSIFAIRERRGIGWKWDLQGICNGSAWDLYRLVERICA